MKAPLVVLALAACSSSKPAERERAKPDCDAYAAKLSAVMGATLDDSRRESVRVSALQACANDRVTAEQASCVGSASTEPQLRACLGLDQPHPMTPPPPAAPKTRVALTRMGEQAPAAVPADQRTWLEALQSNVAVACDLPARIPPATFTVTVHYAKQLPTSVDAAAAPEPLRACLTKALSVPAERPASIWIESLPFTIDVTN